MKNDLISCTFYNENFHGTVLIITTIYFFHLPPTSSHPHSLQVENCDSNSRLVVDERHERAIQVSITIYGISFTGSEMCRYQYNYGYKDKLI